MKKKYLSEKLDCCGCVYPLSVIKGYQRGEVIELESSVLIWHWCGFAFVLGEPSQQDIKSIFEMMKTADKQGKRLVLFCEKQGVQEAFSQHDVIVEDRYFYEFAQDRANEVILPEGFEIRKIDAQLLSRLDGRIKPSFSWDSDESFLRHGCGFCAVCGETAAAWAFSAAVSETETDIGVETMEQFRGKGLAAAVTNKLVGHIISEGKKPVWACHSENIASQRTAERAGFVRTGECRTIRLSR